MKELYFRAKNIDENLGNDFRLFADAGSVTPSFSSRANLISGVYLTVDDNFSKLFISPVGSNNNCPGFVAEFSVPSGFSCFPRANQTPIFPTPTSTPGVTPTPTPTYQSSSCFIGLIQNPNEAISSIFSGELMLINCSGSEESPNPTPNQTPTPTPNQTPNQTPTPTPNQTPTPTPIPSSSSSIIWQNYPYASWTGSTNVAVTLIGGAGGNLSLNNPLNRSSMTRFDQVGSKVSNGGSVDLSNCTSLTNLNIFNIGITNLNMTGNAALQVLMLDNNNLSGTLDCRGLTALDTLRCQSNQFTSLNCSGLQNLTSIDLKLNPTLNSGTIEIGNSPKLKELDLHGCGLDTIVIDLLLAKMLNIAQANGLTNGRIQLTGNSCPGSTGQSVIPVLLERGYSVSVNTNCPQNTTPTPTRTPTPTPTPTISGSTSPTILEKKTWAILGEKIIAKTDTANSGTSVSLNSAGNIVAIGEPLNNEFGNTSGECRIYEYKDHQWIQLGQDLNGELNGRKFGSCVALNSSGDTVVIGATGSNPAYTYTDGSGAYFIYKYIANPPSPQVPYWQDIGAINPEGNGDLIGYSVSINSAGDIIAIGAPSSGTGGRCKIYQKSGNSWIKTAQIDGEAGSLFGLSVSLNAAGNKVAIGAVGKPNGSSTSFGRCSIFDLSSGTKMGEQDLYSDSHSGEGGIIVSLNDDGNRVAIGTKANDGSNQDILGSCAVYEYNNGSWALLGGRIGNEDSDGFHGYAVSLNSLGNRIAIGSPYYPPNPTPAWPLHGIGQTRIYEYKNNEWVKLLPYINGEKAGSYSGYSVSLNSTGDAVAFGSPQFYLNPDGAELNGGFTKVLKYVSHNFLVRGLLDNDLIRHGGAGKIPTDKDMQFDEYKNLF